MRFEIKAGGTFVILVGLAALSGAVFALGLIAGYEIASQSPANSKQVAEEYPVPSPMAQPTPAAVAAASAAAPAPSAAAHATAPRVAAAAASAVTLPPKAPALALNMPVAQPAATPPAQAAAHPLESPTHPEVAALSTPSVRKPPQQTTDAGAVSEPAVTRRRGYHIQIEAAMDRSGAAQMMQRLRALGYTPEIVPTRINGQIWYTVEIGPYATVAAAQAAQTMLRQKYAARFANQ